MVGVFNGKIKRRIEMNKYYSTSFCTSNENGMFEVTMEYNNGFFRELFNKPRIVETWESVNQYDWFNKETKNKASCSKELEISVVVAQLEWMNKNAKWNF